MPYTKIVLTEVMIPVTLSMLVDIALHSERKPRSDP